MPIRFRCNRCRRLLGIARRKAGSETRCPHCSAVIHVPRADEGNDERTPLDDIDELVNPATAAPAVATRPTTSPRTVSRTAPEPLPLPSDDRPLFERDVDSVLGLKHASAEAADRKSKPVTTAGTDAMSLAPDENLIVLSPQKATAFIVIVVILLALSFGAGFLIASR